MTTRTLFGFDALPEQRKPFAPRPLAAKLTGRDARPHRAPTDRTIEIPDGASMTCRGAGQWAQGAKGTFRKSASAPAGSCSPGRDALMGWGERAPVAGLADTAVLSKPERLRLRAGLPVLERKLIKGS